MATYDDILGGPAAQPRPPKKGTPQAPVTTDATNTAASETPSTTSTEVHQNSSLDNESMLTAEGAPRSKRQMSYVEMYEAMHPQKPETAEERAKREKRERSQAVLASIGDGISALSNLFFTSQYAPHAFDASRGQTAATKERWERLRKEREANSKQYFDGYMRALAMDEANDKDNRNWRHTVEREKIADHRYEIKAAQDKALADLNEKLKTQQITAAEHEAEIKRIKAHHAEENEKLDLGYKQAGIRQRNAAAGAAHASATASNARADYYRNGGTGGKGKKLTLTIGKDTYTYGSTEDYERAVERYATEYGVKPYVAYADGKDNLGRPKHTTKRKSIAELAAEVERKAAAGKSKQEDEFSEYEIREEDDDEDFSMYEK